ncbi:hypothetical protein [Prosthecobacter sp.]|uniref:hypothetical protein n=1 Tax=Prosthecobacter sp. TaxID=1965333 RepID=UPI0037833F18
MKDYEGASLANVRRCPQCGGPLLSLAQLLKHEQETQEALNHLRKQSAAYVAGCALLIVVAVSILSFLRPSELPDVFRYVVFGVSAACIGAAGLWLSTAQKFWMLSGSILLQAAALVHAFVANALMSQMMMPGSVKLMVAGLPLGGALLAWHQFRSYCQLLKLEQSKGRGSRVSMGK